MWVLKGAGILIGAYAIFKLGGVGIEWLRVLFEGLRPKHRK